MTAYPNTLDNMEREEQNYLASTEGIYCPTCDEEIEGLHDKLKSGEEVYDDDRECVPCIRRHYEKMFDVIAAKRGIDVAEAWIEGLDLPTNHMF